ncbi:MAG: DUF438 domain-containing protein [Clostridia bacterium]|nr:DUF438 domain-containing protein [Clostridia bacterium]
MSELINNQARRQEQLRQLIQQLHDGVPFETVRQSFEETFGSVSTTEITALEQALIRDGLPVAEIQRLCDVHASVFKGSIEEIHRPQDPSELPGHPVYTFRQENTRLTALIEDRINRQLASFSEQPSKALQEKLLADLDQLLTIDRHYRRKENLLFPYLEKHDITAPPQVMWGVDDEIRAMLKEARSALADWQEGQPVDATAITIRAALEKTTEMIFKEENILFPMSLDELTNDEWRQIAEDSDEIGYTLIRSALSYPDKAIRTMFGEQERGRPVQEAPQESLKSEGVVQLPSGVFSLTELTAMLNALPFDITFVDKDDVVKYFSQGSDRIFERTRSIIGRKVINCHPPASMHVVEEILADFKAGKREHADFWIKMGPRYVLIRYFAVRDPQGEFLGTLEVTQDIAPIQAIDGEKRLLDEG